jgi:hypothetical protein
MRKQTKNRSLATPAVKAAMKLRPGQKPSFSQMMAMRGHFRPYKEARAFVHSLKLNSYQEWLRYCQGKVKNKKPKPMDIPRNPRDTYMGEGWVGFVDWLGTENIAYRLHTWRAYPGARTFVRKLKLPNVKAWRAYVNGDYKRLPALPKDIPTNPDKCYSKSQWRGYGDWLGTGNPTPKKRRK